MLNLLVLISALKSDIPMHIIKFVTTRWKNHHFLIHKKGQKKQHCNSAFFPGGSNYKLNICYH